MSARAARGESSRDPASAGLGERLRQKRAEQGLSLRELARRLEVSPSLLSQIETGKIQPSVRTLYAIVCKLGISLDEVFLLEETGARAPVHVERAHAPPAGAATPSEAVTSLLPRASGGHVQRAEDRPAIELETGVRWERLGAWKDLDVEFVYNVYRPEGESGPATGLVRHSGREFGYVLSGHLGVTVGFDEYALGPGDSISFESSIPHRLHNDGHEDVHAIWLVFGRSGSSV